MFPSERPPLAPGTQIGKYVVTAHLGSGGNGAVYSGLDTVLGRTVALKLLHPEFIHDPEIAGRFQQEARAMAQLNHPHVVTVHDFVGQGGVWAIVMELVEDGETLASVLRRERRLAPERALHFAKQVAAGLGHAHERGIVHRDVKPANVMVVRQGQGPRGEEIAKISDFGIARLVHGEKRTQGQLTLGTLWYLAPEQARSSSVDARADVYALGATLYETLTGQVVFPFDNVARVLAATLTEDPTPPSQIVPELPPLLDAIVLRLIAKDPSERPADGNAARGLLEEVEEALFPRQASVSPSTRGSSLSSPHRSEAPQALVKTREAYADTELSRASAPQDRGTHTPSRRTPQTRVLSNTPDLRSAPPLPAQRGPSSHVIGLAVGAGALVLVLLTCLFSTALCVGSGIFH